MVTIRLSKEGVRKFDCCYAEKYLNAISFYFLITVIKLLDPLKFFIL